MEKPEPFYFTRRGEHVFVYAEDYPTIEHALRAADDATKIFERPLLFVNPKPMRPDPQIELQLFEA
jgi:hypothetical protein